MLQAISKDVKGCKTAEEALDKMGANFEVVKLDIITTPEPSAPILNRKATVRTDINQVLGVVGNKYNVIQNTEVFSFFDALCKDKNAEYSYGYMIDDGRQLMLQAKIGDTYEVRPGDAVENHITLCTSHDGTLKLEVCFTPIRLACHNQCRGAIKDAVEKVSIRHTNSAQNRINTAFEIFDVSMDYFMQFKQTAKLLAQKTVDRKMVESLIVEVFGDLKIQNDKLDVINELVHSGKGNNGSSLWDAYNGVTEWVDHYRYAGKEDQVSKNIGSAISTGVEYKRKAWKAALALV